MASPRASLLVLALAASSAAAVDTVPVNVEQYVGRWYQMYADPYVMGTFERNAVCITADYALQDDGTLSVFNSERVGDASGPLANVSGYAYETDDAGQFKVVFDSESAVSFPVPYWVLALGPVNAAGLYDWAIVSDNLQASLFVLARDVATFNQQYDEEVTATLTDMGFTRKVNSPVANYQGEDCTYAVAPTTTVRPDAVAEATSCKTVEPVANLDFDEFLRSTWYVQQQQITGYQDLDQFYCVSATYDIEGETVPRFDGTVVSVFNYANQDAVNGEPTNTANGTVLCARAVDEGVPSKLAVAPCFLPNALAGPYWVVAFDMDDTGAYTWAAISGGQPTEEYEDGCTTKLTGTNNSGLWIFSRKPVASDEDIAAARQALTDLGYTLSQMHDVEQNGCTYSEAFIKN